MKQCPFCAEDIQDAAIVCKHCGRDLATGTLPGGVAQPSVSRSPVVNSRAIIDHYTRYYVQFGYRVVSQTDTSVQLVKPKQFSFALAFLWFLLLFVGLFIYILYYVSKKDQAVYVHVLGDRVEIQLDNNPPQIVSLNQASARVAEPDAPSDLPTTPAEPGTCPYCGRKIPVDAYFCKHCNRSLPR